MSSNYNTRFQQLQSQYPLEEMFQREQINLEASIIEGKKRLETSVERAKLKGGFSNSSVATRLEKAVLFELIESAGAELLYVLHKDTGRGLTQTQSMLYHFAQCWLLMYEHRQEEAPQDICQLIPVADWIYIGLQKMLDAAATPKSNDYSIKRTKAERRRFEDEEKRPTKPSIQTLMRQIGEMVMFQTRMSVYSELFPEWLKATDKKHRKSGHAGLRYYIRDCVQSMDDLFAGLKLKAVDLPPDERDELDYKLRLIHAFQDIPDIYGSDDFLVVLGSWIYHVIFDNLKLFEEQRSLTKANVLAFVKDAKVLEEAWRIERSNAFAATPMLCPPCELTSEQRGGRLWNADAPTVKTHKGELDMGQERVDFFNTQALVPFKVNRWVFDILTQINASNASFVVGSYHHYQAVDLQLPSDLIQNKPHDFAEWSDKQQHEWLKSLPNNAWRNAKRRISEARTAQLKAVDDAAPSRRMYEQAQTVLHAEAFWLPAVPEFRGRLLAACPDFHYQGPDAAKALIKLAQPVSIIGHEERTRFWLINHIASCFGEGIDKRDFGYRINWFEKPETQALVQRVATMLEGSFAETIEEISGLDKPLMFAAACREFYELFVWRNKTTTDLMVGNDCTCSGQQFAAAWRRSHKLAVATNCIPADKPEDLYTNVWQALVRLMPEGSISSRRLRKLNEESIGRSICKGGIQPAMYGSGDRTSLKGVRKKLVELQKKQKPLMQKEEDAILAHFIDALSEESEMDVLNNWFRKFADACLKAGRDRIIIPTALGDHLEIRYQQNDSYQIQTYKYGGITYNEPKRFGARHAGDAKKVSLARPNGKPDGQKWVKSLAANTTHGAGDATLLALALHDADFHFASNHDAVYCAAPHMDQMRDRVRKAFVTVGSFPMFEKLQEVNDVWLEPGTVSTPVVSEEMSDYWHDIEVALDSDYLLN